MGYSVGSTVGDEAVMTNSDVTAPVGSNVGIKRSPFVGAEKGTADGGEVVTVETTNIGKILAVGAVGTGFSKELEGDDVGVVTECIVGACVGPESDAVGSSRAVGGEKLMGLDEGLDVDATGDVRATGDSIVTDDGDGVSSALEGFGGNVGIDGAGLDAEVGELLDTNVGLERLGDIAVGDKAVGTPAVGDMAVGAAADGTFTVGTSKPVNTSVAGDNVGLFDGGASNISLISLGSVLTGGNDDSVGSGLRDGPSAGPVTAFSPGASIDGDAPDIPTLELLLLELLLVVGLLSMRRSEDPLAPEVEKVV